MLAAHAEQLAARGQDVDVGALGEQPIDDGRHRTHEVLAVVDHQQKLSVAETIDHRVGDLLIGSLPDAQDTSRRGGDVGAVGNRCELDEPRAVRPLGEDMPCDLEREARLARAGGAGQRHQAVVVKGFGNADDLQRPTDELDRRRRAGCSAAP